jgi:hypothetical protein
VWSKDTIFGFSVPHGEKLCAIVRVKILLDVQPMMESNVSFQPMM